MLMVTRLPSVSIVQQFSPFMEYQDIKKNPPLDTFLIVKYGLFLIEIK
jgi:hypothetical protein